MDALRIAESIDGYRAACDASPLNAAARARHLYQPSFLDEEELQPLYRAMAEVPLMKKADVVVLHSSADNGYPHTRPNCIVCMPASYITSASQAKLTETMCHEAMHIHQRRNPDLWAAACIHDGWWPAPKGQIPSRFRERCRLNPDTFSQQQFWTWQTHYIPLPMFIREDSPTLDGMQIKWMDLRNSTLFPDPPRSFKERYGTPPQPEHPYELLAVEFAAAKLNTEDLVVRKLQSF